MKNSNDLAKNAKFMCALEKSGRPQDANLDSEYEIQWGNAEALQNMIAPHGKGKNFLYGKDSMRQMVFSSKIYADIEVSDVTFLFNDSFLRDSMLFP